MGSSQNGQPSAADADPSPASLPLFPGYLRRPISPAERRRAILVLLGDGLLGAGSARAQPSDESASIVSG